MQISELLIGKTDCSCGKEHLCPIDDVIIEREAWKKLPKLTEAYKKILLVADTNTYSVLGEKVESVIREKITSKLVFVRDGVLVPDETAILEIEEKLTDDCELIIGVGSGVINDLCKYVSFKHSLPYYIAATAPSMDGYASVGAALILAGMKETKNARVPKAIIADTEVLSNAPFEMIQAGYGDIIGKYSCLSDWKLSAIVNGEYICDYVVRATYEELEKTVSLADGLLKREECAVAALMNALVAVGILMAYVGNSRPASGSEHHYSHYFEIVGIIRSEKYLPHGIDVCHSAIECAALRDEILSLGNLFGAKMHHNDEKWRENIERIYGGLAPEIVKLQNKLGWYKIDRIPVYREKWQEIRALFESTPGVEEMLSLVSKIGLSHDDFKKLYGEQKLLDAKLYAKDLKDRYSVLWMYYDLFVR